MKNKAILLFASLAFSGMASAFTVTGVSAHQRWPWNNFIDIDFNIGGASASDTFKIDVRATYANGSQTLVAKRFVTDPVVKGGANRITWDIGLDCPNFKADDLRVAVTATPFTNGTDGAWMIIDLSGGKDATSYQVHHDCAGACAGRGQRAMPDDGDVAKAHQGRRIFHVLPRLFVYGILQGEHDQGLLYGHL